jgi:hypothetical protein
LEGVVSLQSFVPAAMRSDQFRHERELGH